MRLEVEVHYPGISLEQCYALHVSEHYQTRVAHAADTERVLVQPPVVLRQGGLKRVARFDYHRSVDASWLHQITHEATPAAGHTEYSTYLGPHGGSWAIVGGLSLFPTCVQGSGTLQFKQTSKGVSRRVSGDLICSLPFPLGWIKRLAEPVIVSKTTKSLKQAAAYTPQYIAKYGFAHAPLSSGPRGAHAALLGAATGVPDAPAAGAASDNAEA